MKKRRLIFLVCAFVCLSGTALSQSNDDTTVTIEPPKSYYVRKYALFPLEIPSIAVKIATIPVGALLKLAEETGAVEKTIDLLSNKERTRWVYPIIEGGAGSGFGGGIGFRDTNLFNRDYMLAASYRIHIDMSQGASLSFGKPLAFELFGRPVSYSIGSDFTRGHGYNYYGIGNSSAQSDQSLYGADSIVAGAAISYEVFKNFTISPYLGADLSDSRPKGTGSSLPSVEAQFPPAELHGFDLWVDYLDLGVRLAHDTRDNIETTEKGGLRALSFMYYRGMNRGGYNYLSSSIDVRQYFRLFMPRQVLVLRLNINTKTPTGGSDIPFYRLTTLDVNSPLRGFQTGRFHDRGSLLLNFEYRYPVWSLMDGVLFYDTGRVYHTWSEISLDKIKYSAGLGLHLRVPNIAFFKLYVAYGGEGINYIFGASKPL